MGVGEGEQGPKEEKLENEKETMVLFTSLPFQEFKVGISVLKAVRKHCRVG